MTANGPAGDPPLSRWGVLGQTRFRRYFLGSAVSNIGTWFQDIAAAIFIFQLTGSALLVAGLAVFSHGTSLLISPFGGQLADRYDRRRLLIVVHLVQGVAAALLALLVVAGFESIALVFAVALVIGFGRAINNPALQAIIPAIVPPRDLAQATALSAMTFNLARVVGPFLGAMLVAVAGAGPAFAVNALSFFVFVALLASIGVEMHKRPEGPSSFVDGLRYVGRHPRLLLLLIACMVIGMATDPVITLGPSLALSHGLDETGAGYYVSAFGLGAVAGSPFAGVVRRRVGAMRTGALSLLLIPVAFAGAALSPSAPIALAFFAIAGAVYLIGNSDLLSAVQEGVDDAYRGRVLALWSMGFIGSRPVAALLDGVVADASTPQIAVAVIGAVILIAGIVALIGLRRLAP